MIGTTKKGIGPAYSTKAYRIGLRTGDLFNWSTFVQKYNELSDYYKETQGIKIDNEKELKTLAHYREILLKEGMIQDTVLILNKAMKEEKKILAEGANAVLLDLDFGTYPYVTSSTTWAGGISTGLGVPPQSTETIIGIVKAYTTRVGEGPFPAELNDETGESLRKVGFEFGATTGRPRRCGWLDLPVIKYSNMLNGFSSLNLTKLDVLSHLKEIKILTKYTLNGKDLESFPASLEDLGNVKPVFETHKGWLKDISGITDYSKLPKEAQNYVEAIEKHLDIPITWIGTGPERESVIIRNTN